MRICDLIEELKSLPDQNAVISIAVKVQTQAYPQAYVTPWKITAADGGRIYVTLPKGFYISQRREKEAEHASV